MFRSALPAKWGSPTWCPPRTPTPSSTCAERQKGGRGSVVFDTVGSEDSIRRGLGLLSPGGALVLLSISEKPVSFATIGISGERRILSSANNRYPDFRRAIELLARGLVRVEPLITHRFPLEDGMKAFDVMLRKKEEGAYKVVLLP